MSVSLSTPSASRYGVECVDVEVLYMSSNAFCRANDSKGSKAILVLIQSFLKKCIGSSSKMTSITDILQSQD